MITLNVKQILEKKKKSKYWLFNELNNIKSMSYTNFNSLVEQKTKSIKYDNIENLCKVLKCDVADLISIKSDKK